jgi:SSS family solute:Na+ symporter
MAKIVSLVVKIGALVFIIGLPLEYAIQLQLLGGIWMIQIFPALVLGLYTRRFNAWALLIGWAVGIASGTWMAATLDFKGTVYTIHLLGIAIPGFAALYALILNLAVVVVLSLVLNATAPTSRLAAAEDYA